MRGEARGYFLKEYGSWSVLIVSYITGLSVSRGFTWLELPLLLALALLINSKQAFTKWLRNREADGSGLIFIGQTAIAAVILVAVFGSDVSLLLPLLVFPAAYLLMSRLAGEHALLTEVLGFTLISLAAVLAKFLITGGVDVRLFVAVVFYFTAGVFKIRALLRKRISDRILTALYVLVAFIMYQGFHIPRIILLPLADNLVAAAFLYKVSLRTTGWIEVGKSVLFLALMIAFY